MLEDLLLPGTPGDLNTGEGGLNLAPGSEGSVFR